MGKLIAVWVGTRRAEHTLGHCGPSFTEFSNYLWARFEAPRKTQGRGARQPLRRGEGGRRAGGRRRSRPWCPSIRPSRRPRPTHHHSAPSPSRPLPLPSQSAAWAFICPQLRSHRPRPPPPPPATPQFGIVVVPIAMTIGGPSDVAARRPGPTRSLSFDPSSDKLVLATRPAKKFQKMASK